MATPRKTPSPIALPTAKNQTTPVAGSIDASGRYVGPLTPTPSKALGSMPGGELPLGSRTSTPSVAPQATPAPASGGPIVRPELWAKIREKYPAPVFGPPETATQAPGTPVPKAPTPTAATPKPTPSPTVAPPPSGGFTSADPAIQAQIAMMQRQTIAMSSDRVNRVRLAEMQREVYAQSSQAARDAAASVNAPVISAASRSIIDQGFAPSTSGVVTTTNYDIARKELGNAISSAENSPLAGVISEVDATMRGLLQANSEEFNRLQGMTSGAVEDPAQQLLLARQTRIAARMGEAIGDIQNQATADLFAQEKANKDLEGKAKAAINAAGHVGSMIGEGYLADTIQNNLAALQSIKNAATRAVNDARRAFEEENDELAFKMVALAENRRTQAQGLLEKNAEIATRMEGLKMQREQFNSTMLTQAVTRESQKLELQGRYEEAAQSHLSNLVEAGYELTPETAPAFLEAARNTGWSGKEIKAYVEVAQLKGKEQSLERAQKFASFLSKTGAGGTVDMGGFSYTVTGTNEGKTMAGVEIDKQTGIGRAWTFNPTTGEKSATSLGRIGSIGQNREIKEIGGKYWSIDPNDPSNAKPVFSSETQVAWEEAFPQGSVGPILPGGDPKNAGQCGAAVNYWTGDRVWGDSPQDKINTLDRFGRVPPDQAEVGDTFVEKIGTNWHVGVVNQVEVAPDGSSILRFTESNRNGDGKVTHDRTLKAGDPKIVGFTRVPLPNLPQTGPDASRVQLSETQKVDVLSESAFKTYRAAGYDVKPGTTVDELSRMEPTLSFATELSDKQTTNFLRVTDKFQANSVIAAGENGRSATAIADAVLADPGNAGKQLSILYTLVKSLDPTSAVKEGEIDLAQQTQSYLGKFKNNFDRISRGQPISKEAATQLAKETKFLTSLWRSASQRKTEQFRSQAGVAGIGEAFDEYLGGFDSGIGADPSKAPPNSLLDLPDGSKVWKISDTEFEDAYPRSKAKEAPVGSYIILDGEYAKKYGTVVKKIPSKDPSGFSFSFVQ